MELSNHLHLLPTPISIHVTHYNSFVWEHRRPDNGERQWYSVTVNVNLAVHYLMRTSKGHWKFHSFTFFSFRPALKSIHQSQGEWCVVEKETSRLIFETQPNIDPPERQINSRSLPRYSCIGISFPQRPAAESELNLSLQSGESFFGRTRKCEGVCLMKTKPRVTRSIKIH